MTNELTGNLVSIKVSGAPTTLAEAALQWITNTEWEVDNENFQVIDLDSDPVLERYDGAVWVEIPYKTVNRLSGKFTFDGEGHPSEDMIRVKSGYYLPMTVAAYAHDYSYTREVELYQVPRFLATYMNRITGQKFASGSLSQWDVQDSYYTDALVAGNPVVLEIRPTENSSPRRVWAVLENEELAAAIGSPQDLAVSFVSTGKLLNF